MTCGLNARQRGLGAITVIVVLVLLAGMAAAIVRLNSAAQTTATQELLAARAAQAARAGLQWGLYQAFKGAWTTCSGASQTLDLGSESGMRVTVGCNSTLYNEGESAPGTARTVRVYTLDAVACNAAASCPDNTLVARPGYVERRWQIHATD
ncbi:MAG: MSHA biogenesis protein MshP [Rubrivivax sp.]|nr:MSHA biogenesis protein MshP [Rubrivivax sp.]